MDDLPEIDSDKTPRATRHRTSERAKASIVLGVLTWVLGPLAAIPAIVLGVLALRDIRRHEMLEGRELAIWGITLAGPLPLIAIAIILPITWSYREHANRAVSETNLRQIGLALHTYATMHRGFPHAITKDEFSDNQLSWRVNLLQFLDDYGSDEHRFAFERFAYTNASFANRHKELLADTPDYYRSPNQRGPTHETVYLGVVSDVINGDNPYPTVFNNGDRQIRFAEVTDGLANTIAVVEANDDQSVPWTAPKDWRYDPKQPRRGLGQMRRTGFLAVMGDGGVEMISNDTDDEVLRQLFQRNDEEHAAGSPPF